MDDNDRQLLALLAERGDDWQRVDAVIREHLEHARGSCRDEDAAFLAGADNDHLAAKLARSVLARLQSLVKAGTLEGEGNWGDPPAHPAFLRVRRADGS